MENTPRCRIALNYAKESLLRFDHSHISSAHLILGLCTLHGGAGDNLLRKAGLSVQLVEGYLSSKRGSPEATTVREGVSMGESAVLAFERAEEEARDRKNTYLGIEHLLLGILAEENGEAADLLASFHIDRNGLRLLVGRELQ